MGLNQAAPTRIIDSRHPSFLSSLNDWEKWRLTYRGGDGFRNRYLERFDLREDKPDFEKRKKLTPIPTFAKAAVNDIRNSIFQRMRDITRIGGSDGYRQAISGEGMGVNRRGATMNAFLGQDVLTDLLVMGRVGVYVDNPVISGATLADSKDARPYLYQYAVEDVLSWTATNPDNPSQYQSILLRDTCLDYDRRTLLPLQTFQRFRLVWINQDTGRVNLQFYDLAGNEIDRNGNRTKAPIELELTRIPFVMLDIADSIISDVCSHQIALLNLVSRDVWYAIQANFTIYTEQRDLRAIGSHLKQTGTQDGTSTTGGQGAADNNVVTGTMNGRMYPKDMDRPGFINPSPEPLKASMALQEKLESDIRKLVNLSVQSVATKASAESKSLDNAGLEAGLSFIGLVLESAERQIAQFWAAYENRNEKQREVATIKYPDRYSLKTDSDRIDEATKASKLMYSLPGRGVKKEIAKLIVQMLMNGRVEVGVIDDINKEIDDSKYLTSDPNTIIQAVEAGLVSDQTGSMALGFEDNEYLKAQDDHSKRIARIQEAQAANNPGPTPQQGSKAALRSIKGDPAARGVADLSNDPNAAGVIEKTLASDTTTQPSRKSRKRGNGKSTRVTGSK